MGGAVVGAEVGGGAVVGGGGGGAVVVAGAVVGGGGGSVVVVGGTVVVVSGRISVLEVVARGSDSATSWMVVVCWESTRPADTVDGSASSESPALLITSRAASTTVVICADRGQDRNPDSIPNAQRLSPRVFLRLLPAIRARYALKTAAYSAGGSGPARLRDHHLSSYMTSSRCWRRLASPSVASMAGPLSRSGTCGVLGSPSTTKADRPAPHRSGHHRRCPGAGAAQRSPGAAPARPERL